MGKSYQLTYQTFDSVVEVMREELQTKPLLVVSIEDQSIGKWSMTALWRSWMGSTAKFMAANGSVMPLMIKPDGSWYGTRPFDGNDAHELFVRQWLGEDKGGNRLSWARKPQNGERVATKSERFHAMLKHQAWMVEKGIQHLNPRDSEFYETIKETE